MKFMRRFLAAAMAASLIFFAAPVPSADAQDTPDVTAGVWAILAMILGSLLLFPDGPGYVDIVGRDCDEEEGLAKWSVSNRGFTYDPSYEDGYEGAVEGFTTHRIVIPKVAGETGIAVGKPEIGNVLLRERIDRGPDSRHSEVRVGHAYRNHLDELDWPEREAAQTELISRFAAARPDSILLPGAQGSPLSAMDGFDGRRWDYIGGVLHGTDNSLEGGGSTVPLRDANGSVTRFIGAMKDDSGKVTVYYQPVSDELLDSAQTVPEVAENPGLSDGEFLYPGMTTNLDRVVYSATMTPEQFETLDRLPPGEVIDVDLEGDLIEMYRIMADIADEPYDGTLSVDPAGALYGDMVLPTDQRPIPAVEVTTGTAGNGAWIPPAMDESSLIYEISDSPADAEGRSNYWIVDYVAPREQVTFDVTVGKGEDGALDGVEAPEGAGNFLPAQVYAAQLCVPGAEDGSGDAGVGCRSLLDYEWGAGATTANTTPLVTDGVVRGTLDVPELPRALVSSGADASREYRRGVFGNDRCMVTRDTENPEDYDSLASTILPSDLNDRFPGQQHNTVGPDNPIAPAPFAMEFDVSPWSYGVPFASGDACDQAAVPIICTADDAPPTSSEPGTSTSSTPGTSTPSASGTTEPTAPSSTTPGAGTTTEPTAPGGGAPGTPGAPDGPGGPDRGAERTGGGSVLPVTGVQLTGLLIFAGAAIAAGIALVLRRRDS